jgi:hypothetical protein
LLSEHLGANCRCRHRAFVLDNLPLAQNRFVENVTLEFQPSNIRRRGGQRACLHQCHGRRFDLLRIIRVARRR